MLATLLQVEIIVLTGSVADATTKNTIWAISLADRRINKYHVPHFVPGRKIDCRWLFSKPGRAAANGGRIIAFFQAM